MLNKVTDNAIIKVVHLFPWYALARGGGKITGSRSKTSLQRPHQTQAPFHLSHKGPSESPIVQRGPWYGFYLCPHFSKVRGEFVVWVEGYMGRPRAAVRGNQCREPCRCCRVEREVQAAR